MDRLPVCGTFANLHARTPLKFEKNPGFSVNNNDPSQTNGISKLLVMKSKLIDRTFMFQMHIYSSENC